MPEFVYFIIYSAVLFYISIRVGNVCLRLIVIVIRHKVFYRIVGEKLLKLAAKLCRKSFVVRKHQGRSLRSFYYISHSKCFTRTRYAEQSLLSVARFNAVYKLVNRSRLVTRRLIFRFQFKFHKIKPYYNKKILPDISLSRRET